MRTKEIFSGRAEDYAQGRPSYADGLVEMLYEKTGFSPESVIADIGSGTGKFAKQLLEKGSAVICVEPNEDMGKIAQRELGLYDKAVFINGDASDTKIQPGAVDFITAAQAFHWFDVDAFKKESKRILKTNGKVVLVWNSRDETAEISAELSAVFSEYCPDFIGQSGGMKKDDEKIIRFFDGKYTVAEFDNSIAFDRERFIARTLSSSYSIKESDAGFDDYIARLNEIFDDYSNDGILIMPNKSVAYIGGI